MKKTFQLVSPNKQSERQIEAIKFEIKKYIARERRKKIPTDSDVWEFDCKIGPSQQINEVIKSSEIRTKIDFLVSEGHKEFYLEILAKPVKKIKSASKPVANEDTRSIIVDSE